jgi:hypothetical protein
MTIEDKLKELTQQATQVSDGAERQRLQREIDELREEIQGKNIEPPYFANPSEVPKNLYEEVTSSEISISRGFDTELAKLDSLDPIENFYPSFQAFWSSHTYKDDNEEKHIMELREDFKNLAKREAKKRKCDAVSLNDVYDGTFRLNDNLSRRCGFKTEGAISDIVVGLSGIRAHAKYRLSAVATFYRLKKK